MWEESIMLKFNPVQWLIKLYGCVFDRGISECVWCLLLIILISIVTKLLVITFSGCVSVHKQWSVCAMPRRPMQSNVWIDEELSQDNWLAPSSWRCHSNTSTCCCSSYCWCCCCCCWWQSRFVCVFSVDLSSCTIVWYAHANFTFECCVYNISVEWVNIFTVISYHLGFRHYHSSIHPSIHVSDTCMILTGMESRVVKIWYVGSERQL